MVNSNSPPSQERTALVPDLRRLSDRGIRAWVEEMAVHPVDGIYVVESESGGTYVVDPVAGTCTCPDCEICGKTCKHLRRVAIEITAGRVPPPDKRHGICRACGTETFVTADPVSLCDGCRVEADDVVRDRESGDRLVVERVRSDQADEIEIPETRTTVAGHPTNEGYSHDDVVVEAVYLTDVSHEDEPRSYQFPLSRLEAVDDAAVVG